MRRPVLLSAVCAAALLGATALAGQGAATATTTAPTVTTSPTTVRVGSFNISSVTFDTLASGNQRPWRERRAKVSWQIHASRLDVVGVQEANPSSTYKDRLVNGVNQYDDLKNALISRGGHWALTNSVPYNCVNGNSTYKCVYQDRGASADTRIIYNADRLSLVQSGAYKYEAQTAGKYDRYLAWAVLKVNSTGKEFLFTNTHLDPYTSSSRVAEWKEAIAKAQSVSGGRPIVAVGDYNTTKYSTWSQEMLPYTKARGLGDVLNQQFQVNPVVAKRAQRTINGYANSFNGYRRDVRTLCYCDRRDKYGNNIDWIFASPSVVVKDWQVVMDVNWNTLQYNGVIPSDHNLVRSTLLLP
ncbi:MAG: Metal-dependent hydrolase, endonuclease/exonuclease/phosphatase family [Marmoricola sp.]|nr:Metal-dependent hydrolase, endonuclease/exonuclease/phosphatase family [Marmoricola sp.]